MNSQHFVHATVPLWKKIIAGAAGLAVILSVLLNATISGISVDYGSQLRAMEREELALALEKKELEVQLAEASSLFSLRQEAESQGFLPAKSIVYANSLPVALR